MPDDGVASQPRPQGPGGRAATHTGAGAAAGSDAGQRAPEVLAAQRLCWAVLGAPAGQRLASVMVELVPTLRRFAELDISNELAALLVVMSPATMYRRPALSRAAMSLRGRSRTKPGSLLKSQIPIRTWSQSGDAVPGFVEIDLVGHESGDRHRDRLDGEPSGAAQGPEVARRGAGGDRQDPSRTRCWGSTAPTARSSSTVTCSRGVSSAS